MDSLFTKNLGHTIAGGLGVIGDVSMVLENTDFTMNTTDDADSGGGGGLVTLGGTISLTGGKFEQNITPNQAGAMLVQSPGTISNVLINNNGAHDAGGVVAAAQDPPIVFDHVTITNNQATGSAGGIWIVGAGSLNYSDVSGNRAGAHGGGVVLEGSNVRVDHSVVASNMTNTGDGAGILVPHGGATIENTTVNSNSAHGSGGGIYVGEPPSYGGYSVDPASVDVYFSTVDANAALVGAANIHDLFGDSEVSLFGSIIAYPGAQPNCNAGLNSNGNNIESAHSCALNTTTDLKDTDPLLGALANNGGPTRSQAIAADSPARDFVTVSCPPPADDQRGYGRPVNGACDGGAFEFGATPVTFTPTPSPIHSATQHRHAIRVGISISIATHVHRLNPRLGRCQL